MNSTIVFDLDGTLINCENKQKFVLFSIINGIENADPGIINDWWRLKRDGCDTKNALYKIGIPLAELISQEWSERIENFNWCYLDKPFPDSIPALEFLKINCLRTIILTARKSNLQVYQAIKRFGFDNFIDEVIIVSPGETVSAKKRYLKKINPTMFIGDTESDYFASVDLKIQFVALTRGQRSYKFLKNLGIEHTENDLQFIESSLSGC